MKRPTPGWTSIGSTILALVALAGWIPRKALGAEALYWTAADSCPSFAIRRSRLDGSNIEEVLSGITNQLGELAVDNQAGKLYWVENGVSVHRMVRSGLDGREQEVLLTTEDVLLRIALDVPGGMIYFTASVIGGGAGIRRMSLGGGDVEEVIVAEAGDVAVDGAAGRIYWVQEGAIGTYGTDIWRAALDGSGPERVVHHPFEHHTTGIALDPAGGKIYWATIDYVKTHGQIVQRANLDGTEIETLTTANPGLDDWPVFIDLDLPNRTVYWVNGEDGVFFRASFDGGEAERLHEDPGQFGPFGLVLVRSPDVPPPEFRRGDANGDLKLDLSDGVALLNSLFLGATPPSCQDAADTNDDGKLDLSDAISTLNFLFLGGPAPAGGACSSDTTQDNLDCRETRGCG
jgi:hypothetical protein